MMYAVIMETGYIDSWFKEIADAREQAMWLENLYGTKNQNAVRCITNDMCEIYDAVKEEINGKDSAIEFIEELIEYYGG